MKTKKNILFTFDYELFLGKRSGTVSKCMIEPTSIILKTLNHTHSKSIFFVDTTYLIRLKEASEVHVSAKADYTAIVEQLQLMIRDGHYVFPHIHPHWIDAVYLEKSNQWQLDDISKYRFHAIEEKEKVALFDKSFFILEEIIYPVAPDYKINGYRAGGWCIQPFTDFEPYFKKHGIIYDFSVMRDKSCFSTAQFYDFTKLPAKNIYRFSKDVAVEDHQGNYLEFSISVLQTSSLMKILNRVWLKYLWKTNDRSMGDGSSVISTKLTEKKMSVEAKDTKNEMVSLELLNQVNKYSYYDFVSKNNFIHFISHPKMLSAHNLKTFHVFLNYTTKHYQIETDFIKMIP